MAITNASASPSNWSAQKSNAGWVFLLQGIAAILFGIMVLAAPGATLLLLIGFLGFYWVVTGVLALVRMFADGSVPWIWSLITGIIGILGGVLVLRHPLVAALLVPTVLVIIFGIQGLIMGTMEIINAFRGGGGGSFILGAVNFLIGLLLLSSPLTAALAVPVVFGILLLVQGVALIIWALRVWRPHSKSPESAV